MSSPSPSPRGLQFGQKHPPDKIVLGKAVPDGDNIGVPPLAEVMILLPQGGKERPEHMVHIPQDGLK